MILWGPLMQGLGGRRFGGDQRRERHQGRERDLFSESLHLTSPFVWFMRSSRNSDSTPAVLAALCAFWAEIAVVLGVHGALNDPNTTLFVIEMVPDAL